MRMIDGDVRLITLAFISTDLSKAKKQGKKVATKLKEKPKPPSMAPLASISAYRPAVSAEQEEALMASILGNMDSTPVNPLPLASRKRKPSPVYDLDSSPLKRPNERYRHKPSYDDELSSDGPLEDVRVPSSDDYTSPKKRLRTSDTEMAYATEHLTYLDSEDSNNMYGDIDMDEFMETDDDLDFKPSLKKEIKDVVITKLISSKPAIPIKEDAKPSWLSVYESLAVETEETLGPLSGGSGSTNPVDISVLEADGSLRFFWLDYLELDGKLYFTGKLKDKSTGAWVSCCVAVLNLERNLFVLPREKRVELSDDDTLVDTDIVPSNEDIYEDLDTIRKEIGVKSWRGKFVKRKYAFGEEIPRGESQWLKVVYRFDGKQCLFNETI